MSMHDRLRGLGVDADRLAALGIAPPEPKTNEPRADGVNPAGVQRDATRAKARQLAEQAVADISAWRAYRDEQNPFARSRMTTSNAAAIARGRELDTEDDSGPSAA